MRMPQGRGAVWFLGTLLACGTASAQSYSTWSSPYPQGQYSSPNYVYPSTMAAPALPPQRLPVGEMLPLPPLAGPQSAASLAPVPNRSVLAQTRPEMLAQTPAASPSYSQYPAYATFPTYGPSATYAPRSVLTTPTMTTQQSETVPPGANEAPPAQGGAGAQDGTGAAGGAGNQGAPAAQPQPDAFTPADNGVFDPSGYGYGMSPCWPPPVWYVFAGATFMSRDDHDARLSRYDGLPGPTALSANDARMPTTGGPLIMAGRYFAGGLSAIQVTYWGIYPSDQSAHAYANASIGPLNSVVDFSNLSYNTGAGTAAVTSAVNNAAHHQITRDYSAHNVEISFLTFSSPNPVSMGAPGILSGSLYGQPSAAIPNDPGGSKLRYSNIMGLRFVAFDEGMQYATDPTNTVFGDNVNEIFFNTSVTNSLVGIQIGGRADYQLLPRVALYGLAKGGVFGNHVEFEQRLYNSRGDAFVNAAQSVNNQQPYHLNQSQDQVSLLGEFGLGFALTLWRYCNLYAGYEVLTATGIAEVTDQMTQPYLFVNGVQTVHDDGALILHGAKVGLTFNW